METKIIHEFDIDIEIIKKAVSRGFFYTYDKGHIHFCAYGAVNNYFIYVRDNSKWIPFYLKDYGKTWALTEEELKRNNEVK